MAKRAPTRSVIVDAIELVQRHGLPITPTNIKANIQYDSLTMGDASDALRKHINAQIPVVMKEEGLVITDTATRERKDFWAANVGDLEEQLRIKEQSSDFDRNRLACDRAVLAYLKEKEREFGYAVYPGLFHIEIDRIYAMHSLTPPANSAAA